MNFAIVRFVTPWSYRREEAQRRLGALRERDGDCCRRCRRPLRFDLPDGHDLSPKFEQIVPSAPGDATALDNLCLCHTRCNAEPADFTAEVKERIRRRNEAELLSRSRRQKMRA